MPNLQLSLTLDQVHAQLKTNGIAIADLWKKSNRHGPHTPLGKAADEQLVELLLTQQSLIDAILDVMEVPE